MSSIERRASVPAAVHPSSASLADILERVLDKGVVIAGDIGISLLDVELLTLKLRLLIASADTERLERIESLLAGRNGDAAPQLGERASERAEPTKPR